MPPGPYRSLTDYVNLSRRLLNGVDYSRIEKKVEKLANSNLTIQQQITELAKECASYSILHYNWSILAGRLEMHRLKMTSAKKFSDVCRLAPEVFKKEYKDFVLDNADELDSIPVELRDFRHNYFSVNVLIKTYLIRMRTNSSDMDLTCIETPQYMWMRTATYLYYPDLDKIRQVYEELSTGQYTHATPTLCRAGFKKPQLASCFLMTIPDDMNGIAGGWYDSALISMNMGGLGKDYSGLRHSEIGMTGESKGVIPWIKIEAEIMKHVDQGGQKRKGSQSAFLCDWHIDIFDFLDMKKETTSEDSRALDMTYALMVSDEFMRRVESDGYWTMFCPKKAPGLVTSFGEEFETMYAKYEKMYDERGRDTMFMKRIKARELMTNIILTQIETGGPFIIYKDAANRKSNQKNLGTIRTSNLCVEIMEYSDDQNIASCNLGSVALHACLNSSGFDFKTLDRLTRCMVRNINQVIDRNYYITEKIERPNLRNRPIGIGVQSLADVFAKLDLVWGSDEANKLNKSIFEVMYYAAIDESANMAIELGKNYETFDLSPMSRGLFQFDMWSDGDDHLVYTHEQWNSLRNKASAYQYNSLLLAVMPTASTASIFNNNECIEPFTENIYTRTVLSGQFIMINKHLINDFMLHNIWGNKVIEHIVNHQGSVQNLELDMLSDLNPKMTEEELGHLKLKYRTAYEIPSKTLIDMAIMRGRYICQSQSLNAWMASPSFNKVYNWHMYGWKNGLKTGMYYLRTKAAVTPTNVSLSAIGESPGTSSECEFCSA